MVDNADLSPEKGSRTLSRLYPGHGHRKTSGRPSTSDGVKPKDEKRDSKESKESKEKSPRDPAVLRKRTSSVVEPPPRSVATLKAGQSFLEQIGSPDHNGWMRKKSDRYNTWKSRYFVLKGSHLYWLRSNSTAVCRLVSSWAYTDSRAIVGNQDKGLYQHRGVQVDHGREGGSWTLWFQDDPRERQDALLQFRRTECDTGVDEGAHEGDDR